MIKKKLLDGLALFFGKNLNILNLQSSNFAFGAGISFLVEKIGLILCEPGDIALVPIPAYHGFEHFLQTCSAKVVYIDLDNLPSAPPPNSKLLILTHPGNPYGEYIKNPGKLFEWAFQSPDLHILTDEVYALSERRNERFESLFSIETEHPDRVHLLYGISKDWGMAGQKFGILVSRNDEFLRAFQLVSGSFQVPADHLKCFDSILGDQDFVANYLLEYKKRLIESEKIAVEIFTEGGVKHLTFPSSLFIVIDFSDFISTREKELEIYRKLIYDFNVFVLPASYVHQLNKVGFFRMVFSVQKDQLIKGCNNIVQALKALQ